MRKAFGLTISASIIALAIATPGYAQTGTPAQSGGASATDDEASVDPDGETDIIVTGFRRSLARAAEIKRNSDQIVDSIEAEDIGKLPDNNASEALARVTGVQVNRVNDEATSVLIRGLGGIATTLNGREMFIVADRFIALNEFAADALAGVDVFKANTAVNLEGGVAGLINIRLRRGLDLPVGFTIAGGARATYNDQTEKVNPNGSLLIGQHWEGAAGEIGVLVNAAYTSSNYMQAVRFDGNRNTPDNRQTISPATVGRNFTFPQDIGIFYGTGFRQRYSGTASVQWAPNPDLMFYVEGFYQGLHGEIRDRSFSLPQRLINNSIGVPLSNVVLSPVTTPTGIPEVDTLSINYNPALYNGGGPGTFQNGRHIDLDTYQTAIGGTWTTGPATLSFDFAYINSRQTDDRLNLDLFIGVPFTLNVDVDAGYGVDFSAPGFDENDPANYRFRGFVQEVVKLSGESIQGRFDGTLDTGMDFFNRLEWGGRFSVREATVRAGRRDANLRDLNIPLSALPGFDNYITPGGFRGDLQQQFRTWASIDPEAYRDIFYTQYLQFFRDQNARRSPANSPTVPAPAANFFIGDFAPDDPTRAFQANEDTYAAYAQAKLRLDLGFPIDGIVGLRLANTISRIQGTGRRTVPASGGNPATTQLIPFDQTTNYLDVLPNASIRARFTDRLQLRLSYSEALARPNYGDLNPAIFFTQPVGSSVVTNATSGNADLAPVRSNNYDATLEYYFSRAGSVTLALFHKDVEGFIFRQNVPIIDTSISPDPILLNQPVNAGKGRIRGVEAAFTTFFDFLPSPFDGFGLAGNITYLDAEQQLPLGAAITAVLGPLGPIPGVSKWTQNLTAFYEKGPVGVRLSYNRRSDFTTNFNAAGAQNANFIFENTKAISRLDFAANLNIFDQVTLTAEATNLLGLPFENYFRDPIYPRDVRYESRTYSLGVRFRF